MMYLMSLPLPLHLFERFPVADKRGLTWPGAEDSAAEVDEKGWTRDRARVGRLYNRH